MGGRCHSNMNKKNMVYRFLFFLTEIQNTTIFSSSRHFLCQSGDQVIEKDLVCNMRKECYDGSDEVLCTNCKLFSMQ